MGRRTLCGVYAQGLREYELNVEAATFSVMLLIARLLGFDVVGAAAGLGSREPTSPNAND